MDKEPEHIQVAHILISFAGAGTESVRSKADAEKLAGDVLARARKGDDFHKLIKELSLFRRLNLADLGSGAAPKRWPSGATFR